MHFKWEMTWTQGTQPDTFPMGQSGQQTVIRVEIMNQRDRSSQMKWKHRLLPIFLFMNCFEVLWMTLKRDDTWESIADRPFRIFCIQELEGFIIITAGSGVLGNMYRYVQSQAHNDRLKEYVWRRGICELFCHQSSDKIQCLNQVIRCQNIVKRAYFQGWCPVDYGMLLTSGQKPSGS